MTNKQHVIDNCRTSRTINRSVRLSIANNRLSVAASLVRRANDAETCARIGLHAEPPINVSGMLYALGYDSPAHVASLVALRTTPRFGMTKL